MSQDAPPTDSDAYEPPTFLITRTRLSRDELVRQYTAFTRAIRYVAVAPELVFEQLISGIAEQYSASCGAEAGRVIEAGDGIERSLERIEAAIQASRDETSVRDNLASENGSNVVVAVRDMFQRFRHDMLLDQTLPPRILPPQVVATTSVGMRMRFVSSGENTGVRIAPYDRTDPTIGRANFPWDDMRRQFLNVQWSTMLVNLDDDDSVTTEFQCTFSPDFQRPPTVICWLKGFDALVLPYRVRVRASDITERGFTMHIEPASARGVSVVWIAGMPANQTGELDITASGPWTSAVAPVSKGLMVTGQRSYTRVALAITQVDISGSPVFPVNVDPHLATGCDCFTWTLNAGAGDRGLYVMKGVYMYA